MKVIIDANVWISYLLDHRPASTVVNVVNFCMSSAVDLLVPQEVFDEVQKKIAEKEYLRKRISTSKVTALKIALEAGAIIPERLSEPMAQVSRDRKDDYLIAYGLAEDADILISGDLDLLDIQRIGGLNIVSVANFHQRIATF